MATGPVEMGIVSFGFAFGEDQDVASTAAEYVDDPDRVLKWGCHTYHRAPEDIHATNWTFWCSPTPRCPSTGTGTALPRSPAS
jgi:hypothetical protein